MLGTRQARAALTIPWQRQVGACHVSGKGRGLVDPASLACGLLQSQRPGEPLVPRRALCTHTQDKVCRATNRSQSRAVWGLLFSLASGCSPGPGRRVVWRLSAARVSVEPGTVTVPLH